jgi:hypothetical protein
MQDQPDAHELLTAVAAFLEQEILPTLADPRLRFRGLIAANVLAVVARELAAGDAPLRAEWAQLAALLGRPADTPPPGDAELRAAVTALNQELCARIRAGEADAGPWAAAVVAHTEAIVIAKLQIANPRYLERVLR